MLGTALESIGATGGMTGSCMLAIVTYGIEPGSDCQCGMKGWTTCQRESCPGYWCPPRF
jgi:hypothetical protein